MERRNNYGKTRIAAIIAIALLAVLFVCSLALAEGSKTFIYSNPNDPASFYDGYRPPIIYSNTAMWAGLEMKQEFWVYAEEGEVLCLGSSVPGADKIIVDGPYDQNKGRKDDAVTKKLDVTENGAGFMNTKEHEFYGPKYAAADNTNGYTPVTYTVTKSGIYKVAFVSDRPDNTNGAAMGSNTPYKTDAAASFRTMHSRYNRVDYVAAWDVTVYNGSNRESGRVWMDYFATNAGTIANPQLWGTIYCLTKNNYTYAIEFNGVTPQAGIFFSNSRGIIHGDKSLYHSTYNLYGHDQAQNIFKGNKNYTYKGKPIYLNDPTQPDDPSTGDYTHCLFLNYPDNKARAALGIGGSEGAVVPNPKLNTIAFVPAKDLGGLYGAVGEGGAFYINAEYIENYSLTVPFSKYNPNLTDLVMEGRFTTSAATQLTEEDVELLKSLPGGGINAKAGDPTWTKLLWNGKDGAGVVVPAAVYGTDPQYQITFDARTAEIHFPLIDAEANANGLIIYRTNENGAVIDDMVYFDGSVWPSEGENGFKYNLSNNANNTAEIRNQMTKDGTAGVHSKTEGAMPYNCVSTNVTPTGGNACVIDFWTYVKADTSDVNIQYAGIKLTDGLEFLPRAQKMLKGRDAKDKEFKFVLEHYSDAGYTRKIDKDTQVVYSLAAKNGTVVECPFKAISLVDAGTYYYKIYEDVSNLPEYVTPAGATEVKLAVTLAYDSNGKASLSYNINGTAAKYPTAEFVNVYCKPTSFIAGITKLMNVRDAEAGEFTFALEYVNADGTTTTLHTAVNPELEAGERSGEILFAPVKIDKVGTFTYNIVEYTDKLPAGVKPVGATKYTFTVVSMYSPSKGTLELTVDEKELKSDEPIIADFENTFVDPGKPDDPDNPNNPDDPDGPDVPDTGDRTNIPALIAVCGLTLAALAVLKKRKF